MISNKVLRELVDEVRATPGFSVIIDGQHVKVTGPLGSTNLRSGSSHHKDDRDWRKALRRYCGWPPPRVGAALNEAQAKAEARWTVPANGGQIVVPSGGSAALALPDLPKRPVVPAVKPVAATPAIAATHSIPAPAGSVATLRVTWGGQVRWTQAVYLYLKEHARGRASAMFSREIMAAVPSESMLGRSSLSSSLSVRWLEAKEGDPFLHIWRAREGHGFVYWYDEGLREHERPDVMREPCLGQEPELEPPVVPEPEPAPPLVIPTPPEPKFPDDYMPRPPKESGWQARAIMATLPDVFERVGAIDGDLLLRDENGDVWRARKGVL